MSYIIGMEVQLNQYNFILEIYVTSCYTILGSRILLQIYETSQTDHLQRE